MDALADPSKWAQVAIELGFWRAIILMAWLVLCLSLLIRGPTWLKIVLEHRRETKKMTFDHFERRALLLKQLQAIVANRLPEKGGGE